jgi:peptidoglycan-associated lipoprotein
MKWHGVVAMVAFAACAEQKAAPPPAPAAKADTAQPTPAAAAVDAHKSCQADNQCGRGELCVDNQCVPASAALAACRDARVHFDYDSAELKNDDMTTLERIARCAEGMRGAQVTIEGNADERGTVEYNLALGERRARSVEKYLRRLGVSEPQLKAISYGKERPLCEEHNESCWSSNRRAEIKPKLAGN